MKLSRKFPYNFDDVDLFPSLDNVPHHLKHIISPIFKMFYRKKFTQVDSK